MFGNSSKFDATVGLFGIPPIFSLTLTHQYCGNNEVGFCHIMLLLFRANRFGADANGTSRIWHISRAQGNRKCRGLTYCTSQSNLYRTWSCYQRKSCTPKDQQNRSARIARHHHRQNTRRQLYSFANGEHIDSHPKEKSLVSSSSLLNSNIYNAFSVNELCSFA